MHELDGLLREYDRARAYTDQLWKDLTPDEVTWRPDENSSAIGWHLGHQAHVAHFMIRNLTAAEPSPGGGRPSIVKSPKSPSFHRFACADESSRRFRRERPDSILAP